MWLTMISHLMWSTKIENGCSHSWFPVPYVFTSCNVCKASGTVLRWSFGSGYTMEEFRTLGVQSIKLTSDILTPWISYSLEYNLYVISCSSLLYFPAALCSSAFLELSFSTLLLKVVVISWGTSVRLGKPPVVLLDQLLASFIPGGPSDYSFNSSYRDHYLSG